MQNSILDHVGLEGFFARLASARRYIEKLANLCQDLASESRNFDADLDSLVKQLDTPFSMLVCGEFNVGKSSLINALAGSLVTPVGPLPTTETVQKFEIDGLVFWDSPGLNSMDLEQQSLAKEAARIADTVLFITSVERPLSLTEKQFITELVERWKRRVIVVLHKIDLCSVTESEAIADYISNSLPRHALLSVRMTSTRMPESITSLRNDLSQTFSERIRQEAKLNSFIEGAVALTDDAISLLDREKFLLTCEEADLSRRFTQLCDLAQVVQSRVSPGLSEGELFEGLGTKLREAVSKHWNLASVAFAGFGMMRSLGSVCEDTIAEMELCLEQSYLAELPKSLHEEKLGFQDEIKSLYHSAEFPSNQDTGVIFEKTPLEEFRRKISLLSTKVQFWTIGALSLTLLIPCVLPFFPDYSNQLLALEVLVLMLPIMVSIVARQWFSAEMVALVQREQNEFVRTLEIHCVSEIGGSLAVGQKEIEKRRKFNQQERQLLDARIGALCEVRSALPDCMFAASVPLFKVTA